MIGETNVALMIIYDHTSDDVQQIELISDPVTFWSWDIYNANVYIGAYVWLVDLKL